VSSSICDFCSGPHVAWRYPAESFIAYVVAGVVGQSVGDWAACSICHNLIEAGDRRGLLERSLQTLIDKNPDMRPAEGELRNHIAQFHCMFYVSQTGRALPVV
jgi:hypothetical protein